MGLEAAVGFVLLEETSSGKEKAPVTLAPFVV
jgi:hypothetical protein